MTIPCPAPACGGEVILGTVEIENGKLARICQCGRSYVWSPANFWQVLVSYLVGAEACNASTTSEKTDRDEAARSTHCCPEIDLNCNKFFNLYLQDQTSPQTTVLGTLGILNGFTSAARSTFNFLDPNIVTPAAFEKLSPADAQTLASRVGVTFQSVQATQLQTNLSPFDAVMARLPLRPGDTLMATVANNQVSPVSISAASVAANAADTATQLQQLSSTAAKQS